MASEQGAGHRAMEPGPESQQWWRKEVMEQATLAAGKIGDGKLVGERAMHPRWCQKWKPNPKLMGTSS